MLGAQAIMTGTADCVVVGGMESMSNVPYYLPKARTGMRLGHQQVVDGIIADGLWDAYGNVHMGTGGELCSKTYNISRQAQVITFVTIIICIVNMMVPSRVMV
jgi:acetyl-CoA C-acetyltransferase